MNQLSVICLMSLMVVSVNAKDTQKSGTRITSRTEDGTIVDDDFTPAPPQVKKNSMEDVGESGNLHNGLKVWKSEVDAEVQNLPLHYLPENNAFPYQVRVPSIVRLGANSMVEHTCPSLGDCEVFVFLYECAGCGNLLKSGPLQYQLTTQEGYERTRCAPTFTLPDPSNGQRLSYQFTAFVKTIAAGSTHTLVLNDAADFVVFGMSNHVHQPSCDSLSNHPSCNSPGALPNCQSEVCENDTRFRCLQTPSGCKLAKCIQQGPSPAPCERNNCAWNPILSGDF